MNNNETIIKDSGSTQEFSTGAHRDSSANKGDCSLLPMDVVSILLFDEPVFACLNKFQETRDIEHLMEAVRKSVDTIPQFHFDEILKSLNAQGVELSCDNNNFNEMLISCICTMLIEVSFHFKNGAEKYGRHNYKFGMPVDRYLDSAIRHYLKTLRGDTDEPHYRAFIWNILCACWTAIHIPELNKPDLTQKSNVKQEA